MSGNLVNCPDCGRPISRLAPICPGCGRPMNQMGTAQGQPTTMIERTPKRFRLQVIIGFGLFLGGLMLAVFIPYNGIPGLALFVMGWVVVIRARVLARRHHG